MDRQVVLEPVGPAGVGKTTLVRALLAERPATVRGVAPLTRHKLASLPRLARVLLPTLPGVAGSHAWFSRDEVRHMSRLDSWQRALARTSGREALVLLDHGPIFRLVQVMEFGPKAVASRRFQRWEHDTIVAWARALDLVIHLDAPEDVLLYRIRDRSTSHALKDETDTYGRTALRRYRRAYEEVIAKLAAFGTTKVLRFDTTRAEPPEIVEKVLDAVEASRGVTHLQNRGVT